MNICFLTAQIITKPQYYVLTSNMVLTHLFLRLPNPKKGNAFYYIHSFSINQTTNNIYIWYNQADYIIIHANILYKNIQAYSKIKKKILSSILLKAFRLV